MTTAPQNLRRRRLQFLRSNRKRQRESAMSLMGHLSELRSRLIFSTLAFVAVSIVAFIVFEPITDVLLRPLCSLPSERLGPQGCNLVYMSPVEPVLVRLKITAFAGIIFASPVWLYQLWAFIAPGLRKEEKRYAFPFVASSIILFLIGTTFAYVTLPSALQFLVGLGGENFIPFFSAKDYLSFVTLITIIFGVTFELPLLLFFLGLIGVVSVEQLRKFRKGALVGITLLAAVVTPSQDPYTMLAMSVPLYLFYELVIVGLSIIGKRRAKAERREVGNSR